MNERKEGRPKFLSSLPSLRAGIQMPKAPEEWEVEVGRVRREWGVRMRRGRNGAAF